MGFGARLHLEEKDEYGFWPQSEDRDAVGTRPWVLTDLRRQIHSAESYWGVFYLQKFTPVQHVNKKHAFVFEMPGEKVLEKQREAESNLTDSS